MDLNEALAFLNSQKDSAARDEELRRSVLADCDSMMKSLNEVVAGQEQSVAESRSAAQAAAAQPEQRPVVVGTKKFHAILASLPGGANVAVVKMLGSFCPITIGHVQCYVEARRLLLSTGVRRPAGLDEFGECLGLVWLNADRFVAKKFVGKKGDMITQDDRAHLVELATASYPWLCYDDNFGVERLARDWPKLRFCVFDMNGADDVLKYEKWTHANADNKMIIMGRPGSTLAVRRGMERARVDANQGHCILGPELPSISSTAARSASKSGDAKALVQLVHPEVAQWLLHMDGHAHAASSAALHSDRNRVKSVFSRFDIDGDGHLRRGELKDVLQHLDAKAWPDRKVNSVAQLMEDGEGFIDVDKFLDWMFESGSAPKPESATIAIAESGATMEPEAAAEYSAKVQTAADIYLGASARSGGDPLPTGESRRLLGDALIADDGDPSAEKLTAIDAMYEAELPLRVHVVANESLQGPSAIVASRDGSSRCRVVVWRGDITTLAVDAAVNAANDKGLGCFRPDHKCIDNILHRVAGPRLRQECKVQMGRRGNLLTAGTPPLVTSAYHLPYRGLLHVTGPQLRSGNWPSELQASQLAACYSGCLDAARDNGWRSLAFPNISTGLFGYPTDAAALVALGELKKWLDTTQNLAAIDVVVLNVFTQENEQAYHRLLPTIFKDSSKAHSATQSAIDSAPVVFFDLASCPFGRQAEGALTAADIPFTKIPIADHKAILKDMTGKGSAPSVWIKGTYVGGCNDGTEPWHGVKPMIKSGKFKEMLA